MTAGSPVRRGIAQWQHLSDQESLAGLPPLRRLVEFVRAHSDSAEELLDQAFLLCEANLEIGKLEYPQWQGLAVVDAAAVFSREGLGGDLIHQYHYDFWDFLRAIGGLAQQSHDPAQYHQCINQNLFSSPADDELIISRLKSLSNRGDIRNLGCMTDTSKLLQGLNTTESSRQQPAGQDGAIMITPRSAPTAFEAYGRSIKLNMDGHVIVRSPFCCNVWFEQPFYWLASIDLNTALSTDTDPTNPFRLSNHELKLQYTLKLDQEQAFRLRLLLTSTTAAEPNDSGRAERHAWIHRHAYPLSAESGISITTHPDHWQALSGSERMSYGLKCRAADPGLIDERPMQLVLVLVLEPTDTDSIPCGQLSLPNLWITTDQQS